MATRLLRRRMVDVHMEREAREPKLAGKLDGNVVGGLLGRERVGLAERHQDRKAVLVRDYVIRELRHGPISVWIPIREWSALACSSTTDRSNGWRLVTAVLQNGHFKMKC